MLGWLSKSTQRAGLVAVAVESDLIKFAHVQISGGRPQATRWGRAPVDSDPAGSLQKATKEHGFGRATCTTLLEPADYQILLVDPPRVPADELKAAIRWRIKDLIEYHIDDATVDVFEVHAEGEAKGPAKAMYAVATPNEVVQKRIGLFEEARVPLKVIDIPEMAQRNLATLFESADKATALLAFSPWGGLLTISLHGELLMTRRLEVTSVQLGQREHGDHYRERVATEITRSLDIFERQRLSVGVGELFLAPLPQDPELEPFLHSKLYVPVANAVLSEVMDFAGGTAPSVAEQWEYFHLFGAAMRVEEQAL